MLGLPRGGVVVAAGVARALHLPLDVLVVRKIGHPWHREFAVGALAENGVVVLDEGAIGTNPWFARSWRRSSGRRRSACAVTRPGFIPRARRT